MTGYQEDAELSISRTAAGDFSYTATGDYTVTNTSFQINGDSFERLISGDTSMSLSASGSFSRSDAYGESHGPYSVSQAIVASADQEDHGSFLINNSGVHSDGTADETGSLDASQTHSQSLSYSKSFGGSMSHGFVDSSSSATYTIDYDDTINYSYAPTTFSATGSFNYERQATAESERTGSKSYSETHTGTINHGTVEGENWGSSSESYSESGDYSMAGGGTSRSVDYTLDELSLADNHSTHSRTYAEGIYTATSVSGTVTTTSTVTAQAGTVVSKPSGSSSFTAHETGSYSEGPSTVSMSVNFSADGSRVEESSATATLSLDHTGSSYSPGMVTEGFHSLLDSDSESISSHSQTFEKSHHQPTGGLTKTASGEFLNDDTSNTEATYDSSRTYTYGGSMAIMLTGSYTSESASVKGVATSHTDTTVSSSLSETGTFSMSGLEPGTVNESRTTTAIEQALTTGNTTYKDDGTYLDGFGGSFDKSSSRTFSLTNSESAIFATGGMAGSPYVSTTSQSGSFSTSESALAYTHSNVTRGFIDPTAAGSLLSQLRPARPLPQPSRRAPSPSTAQSTCAPSRSRSTTPLSATTAHPETGDYGTFCPESVSLGYGAACADREQLRPQRARSQFRQRQGRHVHQSPSRPTRSRPSTSKARARSIMALKPASRRSRSTTTSTSIPSYSTSYSYSQFSKLGGTDGTYTMDSVGWKSASLIESGSYTERPTGMTRWAAPTYSESLIFTTGDSDIGTTSRTYVQCFFERHGQRLLHV